MPRRNDLKRVMLIGSGPIVIGQACEFDYSGTQACKSLQEEGIEVVLINSNPATIMTDPELAYKTYIEPITAEVCEAIIKKERPDALLPTVGGQTGLNVAVELAKSGVLEREGVELIGANLEAIERAENRQQFRYTMQSIGVDLPKSGFASSVDDARAVAKEVGFPTIIRPSYTLGGSGGGIAYNSEELDQIVAHGLDLSPTSEVLVEESVIGWKEFELEVMRDIADNVVIICSIENFDAMGVHTGDSITVAPAQTLTDKEYQVMRNASVDIIRAIGVETGGSNIQFAVNPKTGRMVVIEMNPRVSRSSALASKATGFPIAKIAAKLAIGYTLDEIPNDITQKTPASFEPTIDYCVTKIPRWAFEKFPGAKPHLGVQMKSVGETMAIGRTFKESLQKALRSLEIDRDGLGCDGKDFPYDDMDALKDQLGQPTPDRIFQIKAALDGGLSVAEISAITYIDEWFLHNMEEIVQFEKTLSAAVSKKEAGADQKSGTGALMEIPRELLWEAKRMGFSDRQLAYLWDSDESSVRALRMEKDVIPVYKTVDTCAAEFEAYTPYHYSTYESETEVVRSDKKKIMILGGGPNRIGQGIEFDYCCCHASFALREDGYETIMVNSNPETVSTDYDTSDKLYFEPLTIEDVCNICDVERPDGVIVQFGGQTPLKLALELAERGVPIIGTHPNDIDLAEDRKRFGALITSLGIRQPPNGTATSVDEALQVAHDIGYPVLVRPSYVLGGRAMVIVYDDEMLINYMTTAVEASPGHPVLVDRFLESAVELDVDAVSDGKSAVIGGVMQHIESAGIHSGDSACVLPTISMSEKVLDEVRSHTLSLAKALKVCGLMNVQFAVRDEEVFVLEVNPRASRTVPFVSKAIGRPLAKIAARCMVGQSLEEQGFTQEIIPTYMSVKEAVLPFIKFPEVDVVLGPEMRSTGEVMGISDSFGESFAKAQDSASSDLPTEGTIFVSVDDEDKPGVVPIIRSLSEMGFRIVATKGTAEYIMDSGLVAETVPKLSSGVRPHVLDQIKSKAIDLVINIPKDKKSNLDDMQIRRAALVYGIPYTTTMEAARAAVEGIAARRSGSYTVKPLQDYHAESLAGSGATAG